VFKISRTRTFENRKSLHVHLPRYWRLLLSTFLINSALLCAHATPPITLKAEMSKRKRGNPGEDGADAGDTAQDTPSSPAKLLKTNGHTESINKSSPVIQIIAGSYERVLHGITASISDLTSDNASVQFADTFLFNAHDSAIRCLALSPLDTNPTNSNQTILLATGGSDEKVNVYSLSASPLKESSSLPPLPTLGNTKLSENPLNRELGTIIEHSSNITALHFPTRSKLLSASEDNTMCISRVRDLTVVSTIKAPRPKAVGQPSGDTAPQGVTPAGVNDFAVHPSLKLMLSVGRGERCMRLWNLVTGKKAGVLNLGKEVLMAVKEGKYSSGEGRRIQWNKEGKEFAVAFERGVVVFGEDSRPNCKALPKPLTKVHQIRFFTVVDADGEEDILVVSTEDGRIVLYETRKIREAGTDVSDAECSTGIPEARVIGQLGGKAAGLSGRIKDFEVLKLRDAHPKSSSTTIIVTASSDGAVRLWRLQLDRLAKEGAKDQQIGQLLGTYETGNRITCLKAFKMLPATEEDIGLSEFEGFTDGPEESSSDSDDEDDE
jgi:protein MAK11